MKKNVLIALIVLSTLDVFSQIDKGQIVVAVDGYFMKSTTENGVTTNQNVTQGKYLSTGASVGYFITDRIIAGVGLDYYWSKESRTSELMINRNFQIEVMNIKSKAFLPNIYLGYYHPIINKLYISTNLKFSYGKVKSEYNTLMAGMVFFPSDTILELSDRYPSGYSIGSEKSSDVDYFSSKIFPELTYFIFPKFSLCVGLGGVEYSLTDWKADNSSWTINFNPNYWKFGIKLKI